MMAIGKRIIPCHAQHPQTKHEICHVVSMLQDFFQILSCDEQK